MTVTQKVFNMIQQSYTSKPGALKLVIMKFMMNI